MNESKVYRTLSGMVPLDRDSVECVSEAEASPLSKFSCLGSSFLRDQTAKLTSTVRPTMLVTVRSMVVDKRLLSQSLT